MWHLFLSCGIRDTDDKLQICFYVMKEVFLDINGLSCGYNDGFSISDINMEVQKGSFVGVVGRNGSGKTTLFKGIMSDVQEVEGSVRIEGSNIFDMSIRERSKIISVVSQFSDMYEMTVGDYVLMGRIPYRKKFQFFDSQEDVSIARYYMEMTDTYRFRNKNITELSGGEQQMVCIASALAQQPKLLLLDEPTSHLDMTHEIKVMNMIKSLCVNSSITVMMIIHDLSLASEYCDHIVMMKEGRVFEQGLPCDVINDKNIKLLYDTDVVVQNNPLSGRPFIFPITEHNQDYKMI